MSCSGSAAPSLARSHCLPYDWHVQNVDRGGDRHDYRHRPHSVRRAARAARRRHREFTEIDTTYREVSGLISKHYLMGDEANGGVYMFEDRAKADAWFNDGWADWMEGRFGVRPTLEIFDNAVIVDNTAGEVRVDGKALAEA